MFPTPKKAMEMKIILSIPNGVLFDDQGFCFICSLALTSKEVRDDHVNGRKHKRNLNRMLSSQGEAESCNDEEIMRCEVCDDILFGESSVRDHVNSAKHRERVERKYQRVPETVTADDQPQALVTEASDFVQSPVLAGGQRSSSLEASCPDLPITLTPGTSSISQQQRVDSTTSQIQPALNCQTSDDDSLVDNSPGLTQGEGQFSSKQPQLETFPREAERNNLGGDSRDSRCSSHVTVGLNIPPVAPGEEEQAMSTVQPRKPSKCPPPCNICDVKFTGKESSDEHFKSNKHREKADLQERIEKKMFTTDQETGALIMNMDGIDWYVCKVCLRRMNSERPYQEHIQSTNHLICAASKRSPQQDGTQSEGSSRSVLDNGMHTPAPEVGASPRQTKAPRSVSVTTEIPDTTPILSLFQSQRPAMGEEATNLIPQDSETSTTTTSASLLCGSAPGKNVSYFSRGHPEAPLGNKRASLEMHKDNFSHKTNAAAAIAEDRISEPLVKREGADAIYKDIYKTCKTPPRVYQLHLLCKIMDRDSAVVFLPTGTGKTMTAMMAIRRMLTLNKTRPVLFLTDKVLLAMRQGANILKELGDSNFCRPDLTEEGKMAERRLKVATLCGGLSVDDATPLRKYDIIVITPVCCRNLLEKDLLRWADFSMVIFNEAHHCANSHPYRALMDEYHLRINSPTLRPKILGLMASPAGRGSKNATVNMIKELLDNLGQAEMVAIDEKSDAVAEQNAREKLHSFSSGPKPHMVTLRTPATPTEGNFLDKLRLYFIRACKVLFDNSNLEIVYRGEVFDISILKILRDGEDFSAEMTTTDVDEMVQLVQMDIVQARQPDQPEGRERFEAMQRHVKAVGQAMLNAEDDLALAVDELHPIFKNADLNPDYPQLTEMDLPVEEIAKYIEILRNSLEKTATLQPELLQTLEDAWHIDWHDPTSKALVLIREPEVASKFAEHLKQASFVQQQGIHVQTLVGCGRGSGEAKGMKLHTQDKILNKVQADDKTIIVASCAAEKGIDISQTQLVVCLSAPSAVKAIVQMQGRERKKNSAFVVLHSSEKEMEKMKELLQQEVNMKWAVGQLLHPSLV